MRKGMKRAIDRGVGNFLTTTMPPPDAGTGTISM